MALTPLPSSIGWGWNPQPSDHEPSSLPLDHSFRSEKNCYLISNLLKVKVEGGFYLEKSLLCTELSKF